MKIIHTSDLHLGSPLDTHLSPERARQRRAELSDTLRRMADEAVRVGARLIIVAGDLFDTETPSRVTVEDMLVTVATHRDVDFLYLSGNHEGSALSRSNVKLPENLKLFDTGWTYYKYDGVTVAGRTSLPDALTEGLSLDPSSYNIAVLHGPLTEYGGDDSVSARALRDRGLDYLALGHYHGFAEHRLDRRCVAVYSGTPEGRGFDEAQECGFVLIDTDAHTHRFIPFAKRRVRIIKKDLLGISSYIELTELIEGALLGIPSEDYVRLELVGERNEGLLCDCNALERRWAHKFFCFELRDSSRLKIDTEALKYDKSLKGEFIRLCLEREDLCDRQRELIIRTGLAALSGETTEI